MKKIKSMLKIAVDVVALALCTRFLVAAINMEIVEGGC